MPILAVLALSLAASVTTSMRSGIATSELDVAREIARGQMEQIIATEHDTVSATWNGSTFAVGNLPPVPPAALPGSVVIDSTNPALLIVRVTVDWVGTYGNDSLELTTLIANVAP